MEMMKYALRASLSPIMGVKRKPPMKTGNHFKTPTTRHTSSSDWPVAMVFVSLAERMYGNNTITIFI